MNTPNPVDREVGKRVQSQRISLGMSREALADAARVSVQQMHHWETGANRIGGAHLKRIAEILEVQPEYFFPTPQMEPYRPLAQEGLSTTRASPALGWSVDDLRLCHAFNNVKNDAFREAVVRLVEAMAETENEPNGRFGDA